MNYVFTSRSDTRVKPGDFHRELRNMEKITMTSHMHFLPIVTVALLCLCRWTDCIQVKKDLLHCEMRMNLWTKKMIVWAFCVWALGQKKPT